MQWQTMSESELLLCIPGPWKERSDFVRSVASDTNGDFLFAGSMLANSGNQDRVPVDYYPYDAHIRKAFAIGAQGRLEEELLEQIDHHGGVVYLHFPIPITSERKRITVFTDVIRRCGGLAVKIESTGIADTWDHWFSALRSGGPLELYRTFVMIVSSSNYYYSCGMHLFGFPDVEVNRLMGVKEATDLIDRFNYWQIVEQPEIASGHTFSINATTPRYQITLRNDDRHPIGDLFHNKNGLWSLRNNSHS